ncbi:hypothetical protein ACFVHB_10875 [Kitasatospora sp. NPDC127111]|uniref:hypothetical protein n=1 Tax=Kitasatospora sp. NPDC127111 TaxID=3345363 RepID=UPI0036343B37
MRVDRELCGTTRHVVVRSEPEGGGPNPVGWWETLKAAGLGAAVMAGLTGVFFVLAGPEPVGWLAGGSAGLLAVCAAVFAALGHTAGCVAKKALVAVFAFWENAF